MRWPAERTCPFDATTPTLRACWRRSAKQIGELQTHFAAADLTDRVRTIFVSGSLGRMELVQSSDCDIVVVLSEQDRVSQTGDEIVSAVFDCVANTGFQRPKLQGIFGSATSFEQLLDPTTAGKIDEDMNVFGKRIQSLLDSQPLVHADEFETLQLAILKRYASAPVADPRAFEMGWLVDDLVRYWRSLCARTRWIVRDNETQWRALNVKLRHSRMLLCAGLLHLLWHVSESGSPVGDLVDLLRLVPLERVELATNAVGVAEQYEVFMNAMSAGLSDVVQDQAAFSDLIANGSAISEALGTNFVNQYGTKAGVGWFGELI